MSEKQAAQQAAPQGEMISGQKCAFCHKDTLSLAQRETEVPFFGRLVMFMMDCSSCNYHKADVESLDQKEPCKYTFEVGSEEDMKIRVIRSSQATIKIPHITTITPGPASNGYVTNIEGILRRVQKQVEKLRDEEEDNAKKKKAKNILKKLTKVMWGQEKLKITIEDPSGNSAIISEKAERKKL